MGGAKKTKFAVLLGFVLLAIIVCIIFWVIAIIGAMNLTDGCLYRYNLDGNSNVTNSDAITSTVTLMASGNYSGVDSGSSGIILDPNGYGKWLNTNFRVTEGQTIKLSIKGEISLCRAYIPVNNLQHPSNLDVGGNKIPIPRIEEGLLPPVSLILDARNGKWSNLTELFRNDKFTVALYKDQKTTVSGTSIYNYFTKTDTVADCREGSRTYSPICGRYSQKNGAETYVSSCHYNPHCYQCNPHSVCDSFDIFGDCAFGLSHIEYDWCGCYENVFRAAPEAYKNNGTYTYPYPWTGNITALAGVYDHDCSVDQSYIDGPFQHEKYFWYSADKATGLIGRIDSSINPTNASTIGSNYEAAVIQPDQSFYNNDPNYKIIKQGVYDGSDVGYLQYRLSDADGNYANNTGGFVLNIKQTKCVRFNGNGMNDVMQGRGIVQYVIYDYGANPNTTPPASVDTIIADADGQASITVPATAKGYLWLKIRNDDNDYKDSFGQYTVSFFSNISHGGFFDDVLHPLFENLKNKIKGGSQTIFKNLTCYQSTNSGGSNGSCTNFFNYIRGLLILYIMFYGMMFLLGMVRINQTDLVTRVVKVALVSGLMNDSTFSFFSSYVFDFVTNFSDNIIANMSGYSLFSGGSSVSNPFKFMDEVFTKIFLSNTFAAQMMALLSMGINGFIYFILMFVCIAIVIIIGFRALAVYIMAYFAIAVLIGIAPLFLTFILFEKTRYLFDNWVKFTIRYMIEPTIMLAGIIVLMQLFTIYLDYVIGYSVCWKCAIPFRIPFPGIPGFNPAFLDVPLFCFNWFAPWGFDYRSSSMGINMQNMVVLLMIVFCMWGYIEYSGKMVARLAGGGGGPSATVMASNMTSFIEQNTLAMVGLDAKSRKQIGEGARQGLRSIQRGGSEKGRKEQENDSSSKSKEQGGQNDSNA